MKYKKLNLQCDSFLIISFSPNTVDITQLKKDVKQAKDFIKQYKSMDSFLPLEADAKIIRLQEFVVKSEKKIEILSLTDQMNSIIDFLSLPDLYKDIFSSPSRWNEIEDIVSSYDKMSFELRNLGVRNRNTDRVVYLKTRDYLYKIFRSEEILITGPLNNIKAGLALDEIDGLVSETIKTVISHFLLDDNEVAENYLATTDEELSRLQSGITSNSR